MELSISNETHSLTLCANMAGFGKVGHIGKDHEGSRDLNNTSELARSPNGLLLLRHHCLCCSLASYSGWTCLGEE